MTEVLPFHRIPPLLEEQCKDKKKANTDQMRTNLNVPYAEKDQAKRLGAKWDMARRVWYIENLPDVSKFLRWMPTHLCTPVGSKGKIPTSPQKKINTRKMQSASGFIIGPNYFVMKSHCPCLPWETCQICLAEVMRRGWNAPTKDYYQLDMFEALSHIREIIGEQHERTDHCHQRQPDHEQPRDC